MWDQWSNCAGLKLVLLYIFAVVVSCSLPDRKPRLWSEVHSDNFWSPSDTPNDCIYLIFWGQQVNSSISFLYLLFDPQFSVNQMNCLTVILQTLDLAAECMMLSCWMKIFLTQFEHFSDVLMISPLFCPVAAVFLCYTGRIFFCWKERKLNGDAIFCKEGSIFHSLLLEHRIDLTWN